jgi:hypothetical protein
LTLFYHRFSGTLAAGDQFNFGWFCNSARTLAAAQTAAVGWAAALWNGASAGNGYKDHCANNVALQNVSTVIIDQPTGKQLARADTAYFVAGTAAFTSMPADVALVVSTRTDLPQRRGRGRFYLPQPCTAEATATGRVQPDLVNDVIASLTAAWAGYNSASNQPVLYSRTDRQLRTITSFNVGDLFDTQRRRENKVLEARVTAAMP